MKKIYAFGTTPALAAEAITCAATSNAKVHLVVVGPQNPEEYQGLGATEVLSIPGESVLVENYAKAISEELKDQDAGCFLVVTDAAGRDLAARVAGFMDAPMVSEATDIVVAENEITAKRLAYGGAVVCSERVEGFCLIGLCPGAYVPSEAGEKSEITAKVGFIDERMTLIEERPIEKASVDLTKAEKIVCAGMGFGTEEELKVAFGLAEALGAEVGCTRGLCENNGWFPEYIGLSGIQIKPKLYFSLGVSGQVQHTVGIRGAQTIVAVTKDKASPILRNCDYGIVGDMFDIANAVIEEIKKS